MSDTSQGDGWWVASDGKWYAPEQHADYQPPAAPVRPAEMPEFAAETVAMPAADAQPATGQAFTPAGAATATYDGQAIADPSYNLPATDQPSSKRNLILALGAIVLVGVLGFLAFRFFAGGSSAGGASSPEQAIGQLIASVNERDPVGFVDVFDPDEVDAWFGSFAPAFGEFDNVNSTGETTNDISEVYASVFDAFDYSLTGPDGGEVTYELEPLDDDGRITRVRVEGLDFEVMIGGADTAIITAFGGDPTGIDVREFDGGRLEFRDEPRGLATRLFVPGESTVNEFSENAHLDLVTVQKDGKWFVSIGYSILEAARTQGQFDDFANPDFGRAFELVDSMSGGDESPEAVVQSMFNAIETLDYDSIIDLTDPLATPYLHDYQPLIDSQVNDLDRREAANETDLRFDEIELALSEWEGRTLVTLDGLSAQSAQGSFMLDTASWCLTIEDEFDRDRVCAEDGIAELLAQADSNLDPRDFIPDETGIIVIERNGRWYLDLLGTMGYYTDQLSEVADELSNEFEGSPASEFGDLFIVEGPIAQLGVPATQQAVSGSAGIAMDLSGYPTVAGQSRDYHIAVARVTNDQPGSFVSNGEIALDGEEWLVVYDMLEDDPEIPAIGVNTDGQIDVELFETPITEVGLDGYNGQLGGQGRPQVLVFDQSALGADIQIQGAVAQPIYGFESEGVAFEDPFASSTIGQAAFVVVIGAPGATYTITVDTFEPDVDQPDQEPEQPDQEPGPTSGVTDAAIAGDFAALVEPTNFFYIEEQVGGFFDGCGGPNDPDVTSYIHEQNGGSLMVVTAYPTALRAIDAFDQLVNVASPCEAFTGIEVNDVVMIDIDNVRIEWQLIDDPSSIVFEHYRLAGDTIVVAANATVAGLDDQLVVLDNWFR